MKSSAIICVLLVAGILAANDHFQGRADFPRGYKQLKKTSELHNTEIDFTFFIKQCNFAALDRFFWDVSNPKHDLYGKYMTLEELNDLRTCSEEDVPTVLEYINHFNVKEVKVIGPTAIEVRCTVAVAEQMLETEFFEVQNVKSGKIHIRQKGSVALPGHLHDIINFVGGISEFFDETKYETIRSKEQLSKRIRAQAAGEPLYDPNTLDVADQWVTPILLQDAYSIPNTPLSDSNKLGIAAFDNDYDDFGFCRFQDLFGGYRAPPSITYQGPVGGSDQVESDLDVQYSTAIASGISAIFQNHGSNKWILDWATNSVQDANRPYVWSISYGWPEIWQCIVVDNLTTDCPTGYSYQKYINVTNEEIAALGSLGVSVMVSSGDAGTPGFSANCPFNPNVEIVDAEAGNVTSDCQILFGKGTNCGCGNALITFEFKNQTTVECVIPAGLEGGSPGCAYIFGEGEGGEGEGAESFQQQVAQLCGEAAQGLGATPQKDCQIANLILEDALFISTCNCSEVTPKVMKKTNVGTCTASGYDYNPALGPAFLPDFPTTSRYVTSVGATAMQYTSAECSPSVYTPQIYAYTLDPAGFSGGGGFSSFQESFSAQQNAVQSYLRLAAGTLPPATTFNSNNRAYPDVSFLGHNFIITLGLSAAAYEGAPADGYGGTIYPVGGTSASSPSFAGMVARLNDYMLNNNLPTLGPLNQLLYTMAAEAPGTFSDIVPHYVDFLNVTFKAGPNSNCNEAFCCDYGFLVTPGWDPATGLGTPNYNAILQYIISMNE